MAAHLSPLGSLGSAICVAVALLVVISGTPVSNSLVDLSASNDNHARPDPLSTQVNTGPGIVAQAARSLEAGAGPAHGKPWGCHGIRMLATAACGETPSYALPPMVSGAGPGWRQISPAPPPQALYNFEMTYDASDGYVLLMGSPAGQYQWSSGPSTDLWKFSHGNWTALYPATYPQNCPGSSLSYDDADGYVVYLGATNFGGSGLPGCRSANETWIYHAGTWNHLSPTGSPIGRFAASLTNDTGDGYLLLFGGESGQCGSYGYCGDTWKFKAGQWAQLTPTTSPSNRTESGMAYDTSDGYVLLFGGTNSTGNHNDSWSFKNGNWTQLNPAVSPPVPQPDAFSYDAADQVIVYTNAYNNFSGTAPQVLWTYHADNWTRVTAPGPGQRLGAALAYDVADGYMVFFGGYSNANLHDTWEYRAGAWTNLTAPSPEARQNAGLTYDAADGYVLLFGGLNTSYGVLGDTWTYAKGTWTRLFLSPSPPAREMAGMVYDASDGYVLLFGGQGATRTLEDTWEYTAGVWTQITPTTSPSNRTAGHMVYDGFDGYVLLFSGWPYFLYRDTWTYHGGVWTNRTASLALSPPAVSTNPLVYDSLDQYVLLFGTYQVPSSQNAYALSQNQSWTFAGGNWTNITAAIPVTPPAVEEASLAFDGSSGRVIFFGGSPDAYYHWLGGTWSYTQGNWTQLFPTASPDNRSNAAITWDGSDSLVLLLGGTSNGGNSGSNPECWQSSCDDSWVWQNGVGSRPYIRSFHASPSTVDVGIPTLFSVSATGGMGQYSYSFTGLPSGCTNANTSSLVCTPRGVGTYLPTVNVTDSAGNSTIATTSFTVDPVPSVSSFNSSPASVTLGNRTILSVTGAGGTPPFSYNYSGLPSGCRSQTVPALPCTPTAAGVYPITVQVTDADHLVARSNASLTVHPAGLHGSPMVSAFGASPSSVVLGNSTNFTVTASGGNGYLNYSYTGLPAGCASANTSVLSCSPTTAGTYSSRVTVTDAAGAFTRVATNVTVYPVGGGTGALITAFAAVPALVDVRQTAAFLVSATGGKPPLSFSYSGLPVGCATANMSSLVCTPAEAGSFRIVVNVTDSAGHSARVGTLLTVRSGGGDPGTLAPLRITSFSPTPTVIAVGQTAVLRVMASGGSGTLTYQYSGLPEGCRSESTPTLPCTPSAQGKFTVGVRVVDPLGTSVNVTTPLTVTGASHNSSGTTTASTNDGASLIWFGFGVGVGTLAVGLLAVHLLRRRSRGQAN